MTPQRPQMAAVPNTAPVPHAPAPGGNMYNPPRPVETYTLPDSVNAQIPDEVRQQFHRDDQGRILFCTAPPLNRERPGVAPENVGLGHSMRYLSSIREHRAERTRNRKERDEAAAEEQRKRRAADQADKRELKELWMRKMGVALSDWLEDMDRGTKMLKESLGGWDSKAYEDEEVEKKREREAKEKAEAEKSGTGGGATTAAEGAAQ